MIKEKPIRSIVKTITWRIIAMSATVLGVYIYSKKFNEALIVGVSLNLIKMFLYYLHERGWNKIHFGRIEKKPEYYI